MTTPLTCAYPSCKAVPDATGLCAPHVELMKFFVWAFPRISVYGYSVAELLAIVVGAQQQVQEGPRKVVSTKPKLLLPKEYVKGGA